MQYYNTPLTKLVEQFEKLPGIGHKSALRLAFHVLSMTKDEGNEFATAILDAKEKIHFCQKCFNITDKEICNICSNDTRDTTTICVVENARDIVAFEKTREYKGLYHVLQGVISPMDGIGPDEIRVRELLNRTQKEDIKEVIMATNPDVEGEATALYISNLLKPFGIKVSRLALGIPVGGDLEYADEITLLRAMEGRTQI
ncbi:MAG: recombination mediator RecR [Clostridia bacterium]